MFRPSPLVASLLIVLAIALAGPAAARAQQAAPADPADDGITGFLKKVRIDRAGGVHLSKLFSLVFGGIKQGSSMAAGPAVSHEFENGAFTQVKGVYSIRHFKLLQARFDSGPLFNKRAMMSTRVRWQDAPELSLYALGPDSPQARAEYAERRMEWSGFIRAGVAPHLNVTGGAGIERYTIGGGFIDTDEDERLGIIPDQPGLATHPWFIHSYASLVYDSRYSSDYSRTGTTLLSGTHLYHDMQSGSLSFRAFEVAAGHLFPTVRTGNGPLDWKGALAIGARAWLTESGDGSSVPFFLMPTLGGGDYLIGYPSYRFRDRNAVLLRAEYRWAVHPMIDVAGLYEAGTVSPTVGRLSLDGMAQSAGAGIRVHSKTTGLVRIDLARGREGLQFSIGFNITGG
jgi:hypothetical protein